MKDAEEKGSDLEKALDESLDELQKAAKGEELSKSSAEEESAKGKSEEDEDAKGKKEEEDEKGGHAPWKGEGEEAKGKKGEEDEDAKGEKEEEDEDEEAKKKGFRKSVEEKMEKSETVQNGIEVSKFLRELVKSQAEIMGTLVYRMSRLEKSNRALGEALVKSFGAQSDVIKSLGSGIETAGLRPLARKSVDSKTVTTLEKGFRNNPDKPASGVQDLTKSEIASKMADLEIGGKIPAGSTSKFEMTGEMQKSVESLVLGA